MEAQRLLFWGSLTTATICFWLSMAWYTFWGAEHDWIEKISRSILVWLQVALWGGVVWAVLLMAIGVNFGGAK